MKVTSNVKGQLAIIKAELRALELGYVPSKPIFNSRYDLVIDDYTSLKRVQVKYANNPRTPMAQLLLGCRTRIEGKGFIRTTRMKLTG